MSSSGSRSRANITVCFYPLLSNIVVTRSETQPACFNGATRRGAAPTAAGTNKWASRSPRGNREASTQVRRGRGGVQGACQRSRYAAKSPGTAGGRIQTCGSWSDTDDDFVRTLWHKWVMKQKGKIYNVKHQLPQRRFDVTFTHPSELKRQNSFLCRTAFYWTDAALNNRRSGAVAFGFERGAQW